MRWRRRAERSVPKGTGPVLIPGSHRRPELRLAPLLKYDHRRVVARASAGRRFGRWGRSRLAELRYVRRCGGPTRASLVIKAASPLPDIRRKMVKPVWIARLTATLLSLSRSPAACGQNRSEGAGSSIRSGSFKLFTTSPATSPGGPLRSGRRGRTARRSANRPPATAIGPSVFARDDSGWSSPRRHPLPLQWPQGNVQVGHCHPPHHETQGVP